MPAVLTRPTTASNTARPKISTHLQLVSPKQARDLVEATAYPRQRALRRYKIEEQKYLIARHELRPGTVVSFATCREDQQTYLINGTHTLIALGETTGAPYWLQFESHTVDSIAAVDALYVTYDRGLSRSWTDLYHADSALQQRLDVPPLYLNKLGSVTQILARGFAEETRFHGRAWVPLLKNAAVRFALMQDWAQEIQQFVAGCQGPSSVRKLLLRSSVLAVALVTYRFQPDQAQLFWPQVARDSGLCEGEPAHSLLRYLRDNPTRQVNPATYQRAVASAWNAWHGHRVLHKVYPRSGAQPILIAGTPHDGTATYVYLGNDGTIYQTPRVDAAEDGAAAQG